MTQKNEPCANIELAEYLIPAVENSLRTCAENAVAEEAHKQGSTEFENLSLAERATVFVHEAGNALQAIGLAVQFVQLTCEASYADDLDLKRVIKRALKEIDTLGSLLQAFGGSESGACLELEFLDLAALVEDILAIQELACIPDIVVKLEREPVALWANVDAVKIKQLIINLCKNAREAMPRGGELTVKLHQSGAAIILEVSDSGVGIADDLKCFELFQTSKSGGSGVGLALAHEIVTAHQGTIDYVSEPGWGTTFTVSLPHSKSAC
jgi:signal transduction histidine kinase